MIKQIPSPNFTKGRKSKVSMVVIHIMAGSLIGTDNWFSQKVSSASSHYGVGFKGEVHQYVQESDTAWHSGVVKAPTIALNGANPNDIAIGIECEGSDLSKAPQAQIDAIIALVEDICKRNNIPVDRQHIVGHYQINSVTRANCPSTDKSILDVIVKKAQSPKVCPTCGQLVA